MRRMTVSLLLILPSLAGCATGGPAISRSGCEWVRPILLSRQDALTDPTLRAILAHNEAWQGVCGL